ncbi:MAG: MogA/MoaB family molybdenum cofactor biosynthesis protein [Euryarchaeota archaeon]|nr:MogA/MoaB family molybdenum cofactor biosynthesis protein [Euryarchaeota archaeon]
MNTFDEHRRHAQHGYTFEVATISSSRYRRHENANSPEKADDVSGSIIIDALCANGHTVRYTLLPDDIDMIQDWFKKSIMDADALITTGGTGLAPGDVTIEAIRPLLEKEMPGFGEIFRANSMKEIGSAAMLTRAIAGVASGCTVFCMPGSPNAVKLGIELITSEIGHVIEHAKGRV